MDRNTRYTLTSYLGEIKSRCNREQQRLSQLSGYENKRLKVTKSRSGNIYYYIYSPDSDRYVYSRKSDSPEVLKIKEAHYLDRSVKELRREIKMIENVLRSCKGISYADINMKLGKAYKDAKVAQPTAHSLQLSNWKKEMESVKASYPPYRPHELIQPTNDGTMVRSKSEAFIYNYLLDQGITFIYELPLKIKHWYKGDMLLPDFTIHSEIDMQKIIYLEHQGMMDSESYRQKYVNSVCKYWLNGYIPERDVFFTFDLPNGGFDGTPVKNIIRQHIRLPGK